MSECTYKVAKQAHFAHGGTYHAFIPVTTVPQNQAALRPVIACNSPQDRAWRQSAWAHLLTLPTFAVPYWATSISLAACQRLPDFTVIASMMIIFCLWVFMKDAHMYLGGPTHVSSKYGAVRE